MGAKRSRAHMSGAQAQQQPPYEEEMDGAGAEEAYYMEEDSMDVDEDDNTNGGRRGGAGYGGRGASAGGGAVDDHAMRQRLEEFRMAKVLNRLVLASCLCSERPADPTNPQRKTAHGQGRRRAAPAAHQILLGRRRRRPRWGRPRGSPPRAQAGRAPAGPAGKCSCLVPQPRRRAQATVRVILGCIYLSAWDTDVQYMYTSTDRLVASSAHGAAGHHAHKGGAAAAAAAANGRNGVGGAGAGKRGASAAAEDEEMKALVARHNKKFKPAAPAYVPTLSIRDTRKVRTVVCTR